MKKLELIEGKSLLESLLSSALSSASSPFSNLLLSIRRSVGVRLPNTAMLELPTVIEKDTQEKLIKIGEQSGIMAAGEVILKSIDEINNGSLETVDKVIRKRLENTAEVVKAGADKDNTGSSPAVKLTGASKELMTEVVADSELDADSDADRKGDVLAT